MLFEKIAGTTLQALNYKLDFLSQSDKEFSSAELKMYDELNKLFKQKAKQQKPGDTEKRMMQEALINNIRKRLNYTVPYNDVEKIAV